MGDCMINMISKLLILLLVNSITGFFLDVDVDTESGSPLTRALCCLTANANSRCATACSGQSCTAPCVVRCGVLQSVCLSTTCQAVASTTCVAATTTAAATTACTGVALGVTCNTGDTCCDGATCQNLGGTTSYCLI